MIYLFFMMMQMERKIVFAAVNNWFSTLTVRIQSQGKL